MLNVKFKIMSKVKIILNGEEKILDQAMSVLELVRILELDVKKIAVEKDLEIVNPDQFSEVILDEGSRVEIVHFIGGGWFTKAHDGLCPRLQRYRRLLV